MTEDKENYSEYVKQAAKLMGLNITPDRLPGVVDNFHNLAKISALVTEFELTEDTEIAATFKPKSSKQ